MRSIAHALPALVLSVSLSAGCAAMAAQYDASLDNAVTVSPVDQQAYSRVAIDSFVCTEGGYACQPHVGQQSADQLAMTMGRIGYEVYDSAQFQAMVAQPPTIIVSEPGYAGASLSVGPNGVSIHANDGYEEVSVSAGVGGAAIGIGGGPAQIVYYETLPVESRQSIMERSGIRAVATGRITVAPPDETTGWQEVHVMVRLGDAATGALIWQGEWRENAMDEPPEQAISEAMQHLDRALQRKAPLRM